MEENNSSRQDKLPGEEGCGEEREAERSVRKILQSLG